MIINVERFNEFSRILESDGNLGRMIKLITEPDGTGYRFLGGSNFADIDLLHDADIWKIPTAMEAYMKEIKENDTLSFEEKVMEIYMKLCKDYVYDDFVLAFIKQDENSDNAFELPDFYGRKTDDIWKENREKNNKLVCFEISRILAKAIKEISENEKGLDVCLIWDEMLTHYFVGLMNSDYFVTLDIDDFRTLKDITRGKMDLTFNGIKILKDPQGKFSYVLEEYNKGRYKNSTDLIYKKFDEKNDKNNESGISDDKQFIELAVEVLKDYNVDPQGIFEYIKKIVDKVLDSKSRRKVWKKVKNEQGSIQYTRCLVVKIQGNVYIIDGNETPIFKEFDENELNKDDPEYLPYNSVHMEWDPNIYHGE